MCYGSDESVTGGTCSVTGVANCASTVQSVL